MRAIRHSLHLIDNDLRENEEANRLFLEILTSKNDAETVLRRMNEAGVLGKFVRTFGRIVAMMQFNMYHHYTVDEHLLRCIGILSDIEAGRAEDAPFATELMRTIQPEHRTLLYVALFLHDIAKGRIEDHSIAGARVARRLCPRFGLSPAETDTVAWLVEQHLTMSSGRPVTRPFRPGHHPEFRRGGAIGRAAEASDPADDRRHQGRRPRRLERLEGPAHPHAVLRDRAGADRRLLGSEPRPARRRGAGGTAGAACRLAGRAGRGLCRPPLSGLLAEGRPADQGRACTVRARHRSRRQVARDRDQSRPNTRRGGTDGLRARPPAAAVDHRGCLRDHRGQHRRRADLHHDRRARARHHRGLARLRARR